MLKVKEPYKKFFISLTIGDKTTWFVTKWIVDSESDGIKNREIFDNEEDAKKTYDRLVKDYESNK